MSLVDRVASRQRNGGRHNRQFSALTLKVARECRRNIDQVGSEDGKVRVQMNCGTVAYRPRRALLLSSVQAGLNRHGSAFKLCCRCPTRRQPATQNVTWLYHRNRALLPPVGTG